MTLPTQYISPRAEEGKQEAIGFLRLQPDFVYELIQAINVAEEGFSPIPVPREVAHFLRTILHAAGDEHEFALQIIGLSYLDSSIVERDAVAPKYEKLGDGLELLRPYVEESLDSRFLIKQYDFFIQEAQQLVGSENFQIFSGESFDEIRARNLNAKLGALDYELDLAAGYSSWSTRGGDRHGLGNWGARHRYELAERSLAGRGAFG